MTITIKIDTGNAAFEDNPRELREVLTAAIEAVLDEGGRRSATLRDSNGNSVGTVAVKRGRA